MSTPDAITPPFRFALEPVCNALNSFALLNHADQHRGSHTWVSKTATDLTPEQLKTNQLLFTAFRDLLTPDSNEPNFPSYLHNLSELDPYTLRQRLLEPMRRRFSSRVTQATPHTRQLINDIHTYLHCLQTIQGEQNFPTNLYTEAHTLLQDPQTLRESILTHLDMLWKTAFIAEWRRVQPTLRRQVEMFTANLTPDSSLIDTFSDFTGRELPSSLLATLKPDKEVILIPSWHSGRTLTTWDGASWDNNDWGGRDMTRIFFSEPLNDVSVIKTSPIKSPELQARLNTLADETRLAIIELLRTHDELSAQEIITELQMTQSSVSRHLKQLVSMCYLQERRLGDGASKTYRLSSFHLRRTAQAIAQLSSADAPSIITTPVHDSSDKLGRFLDQEGKLKTWPPAKQQDKLLILHHLAALFEFEHDYTEKEVNAILLEYSAIKDAAALRRALCEYHFVDRTPDGSRYWRLNANLESQV